MSAALASRSTPLFLPAAVLALATCCASSALAQPGDDSSLPEPAGVLDLNPVRAAKESLVFVLAFTPDGKGLAAATQTTGIVLFDAATGAVRKRFPFTFLTTALSFSPKGDRLMSGGAYEAHLFDLEAGVAMKPVCRLSQLYALLAPDGKTCAVANHLSNVQLRSVPDGAVVREFDAVCGMATALAFSADGKTLFVGGVPSTPGVRPEPGGAPHEPRGDTAIRLWNTATGELRREFPGPEDGVAAIFPLRDGEAFLTFDLPPRDRSAPRVRRWAIGSGKETQRRVLPDTSPGARWCFASTSDGRTWAYSIAWREEDDDHAVFLYDVSADKPLGRLLGAPSGVVCLTFSADDTKLACGTMGGDVLIWDVAPVRRK